MTCAYSIECVRHHVHSYSPTVASIVYSPQHASPPLYTLSLHDALPILHLVADVKRIAGFHSAASRFRLSVHRCQLLVEGDRKSTRLNSSHRCISYAVLCLKKKTTIRVVIYCRWRAAHLLENVSTSLLMR